jgi:hypothetical protein
VKETKSPIFTVNEKNHQTKGGFQMEDYIIFETIRTYKEHGGTLMGVHKSLSPILISE